MEVIIPANTGKFAMDEQIHQIVAHQMRASAEAAGWPYEIHTLEELASYYFADPEIGRMPWSNLKEKVFVLHMQDFYDNYDTPLGSGYTNYTCGPAYLKWHSMVFGIETNHWSIANPEHIAESGLMPCTALLKLGSTRFSWEKTIGYPVNLVQGDFRISIRPVGVNASQRRASRVKLWNERMYFNLQREMPDRETTVTRVRYFGQNTPLEYALCLRMRGTQSNYMIKDYNNKAMAYESFKDHCSTFLYIPLSMEQAGTIELVIKRH